MSENPEHIRLLSDFRNGANDLFFRGEVLKLTGNKQQYVRGHADSSKPAVMLSMDGLRYEPVTVSPLNTTSLEKAAQALADAAKSLENINVNVQVDADVVGDESKVESILETADPMMMAIALVRNLPDKEKRVVLNNIKAMVPE